MPVGVTAKSHEHLLRYRERREHAAFRSKYRSTSFRGPNRLVPADIGKISPSYRVVIQTPDGRTAGIKRLASGNDVEAWHAATVIADRHAVDLWDGVRFIERFEPKTGSIALKH